MHGDRRMVLLHAKVVLGVAVGCRWVWVLGVGLRSLSIALYIDSPYEPNRRSLLD